MDGILEMLDRSEIDAESGEGRVIGQAKSQLLNEE